MNSFLAERVLCDKCPPCAWWPHHSHMARRPQPADLFALVTSALPVVFVSLSTTLNERVFSTVFAKTTPTLERARIGSTSIPPVCESRAESHTPRSSHQHRVATNIRFNSSRSLQTKQQRPEYASRKTNTANEAPGKTPTSRTPKKKKSPDDHRRSHSTN